MTLGRRFDMLRILGGLAAVTVLLLALWRGGLDVALLLLPPVAMFWLLVSGRTPGEQLITRLRDRRAEPRRRPVPALVALRPVARPRVLRGTLLAWRLAGRAPPRMLCGQLRLVPTV